MKPAAPVGGLNVELAPREKTDDIGDLLYEGQVFDIFLDGEEVGTVGMASYLSRNKGKWRACIWFMEGVKIDSSYSAASGHGDTPFEAISNAFTVTEYEMTLALQFLARMKDAVTGGPGDAPRTGVAANRLRMARPERSRSQPDGQAFDSRSAS